MDISKVKNFIIIILLVSNIFLLTTELIDDAQENEIKRAATADLVQIFEERGVSLPTDIDIYEQSVPSFELTRNQTSELTMVQSLLGDSTVSEQGGNIYVYNGKYGQAVFRGTGEFEILLNHGTVENRSNEVDTAVETLEKMGFTVGTTSNNSSDSEQHKVTMVCMYNGCDVYNASIECLFSGDNLIMITGKRFFDETLQSSDESSVNLATALLDFSSKMSENGVVCTEILAITQVYEMSVAVSGDCSLSPMWHIITDTGEFMTEVSTGKFVTIS